MRTLLIFAIIVLLGLVSLGAILFCLYTCLAESCGEFQPKTVQIPILKDAEEYLKLAVQYKHKGWAEPAREACLRAIALKHPEISASSAAVFLRACLPKEKIKVDAVNRNIFARWIMLLNHEEGMHQLLLITKDYPNFEWPYANLGLFYSLSCDERANVYLDKALRINPHYFHALEYKAKVLAQDKKFTEMTKYKMEAHKCFEPIDKLDPALQFIANELDETDQWLDLCESASKKSLNMQKADKH